MEELPPGPVVGLVLFCFLWWAMTGSLREDK